MTDEVVEPTGEWWNRSLGEEDLAVGVITEFYRSREWIHRRVESLTFLDGTTFMRKVSLDFTIPAKCPQLSVPGGATYSLAPVSLLKKKPLVEFSLRGPNDSTMFNLTAEQNGAISLAALVALAAVHGSVSKGVEEHLRRIVFSDPKKGLQEYESFISPADEDPDGPAKSAIVADAPTKWLLRQLAENFLFVLVLDQPRGTRTVVKYSHRDSDAYTSSGPLRSRIPMLLGWRATPIRSSASSASGAGSFHFEVSLPGGVAHDYIRLFSPKSAAQEAEEFARSDGNSTHVNFTKRQPFRQVDAEVLVRPAWRNWLFPSAVASALSSAMVWAFAIRAPQALSGSAAGGGESMTSALLLGITGVLATLLTRPGEHGLATRLVGPLRFAAVVSVGMSFPAAILIALGLPISILRDCLIGMAVATTPGALFLITATLVSRSRARSYND